MLEQKFELAFGLNKAHVQLMCPWHVRFEETSLHNSSQTIEYSMNGKNWTVIMFLTYNIFKKKNMFAVFVPTLFLLNYTKTVNKYTRCIDILNINMNIE